MGTDLTKHNWADVQQALYDLMAHTEETEPDAVNFIRAIEDVLPGLPDVE